jgi:hypothetical protein
MSIAVMVKYPAGHHRHAVEPEWHAWGGSVFAPNQPDLDNQISLITKLARRLGCQVRIQRVATQGGE